MFLRKQPEAGASFGKCNLRAIMVRKIREAWKDEKQCQGHLNTAS